MFEWIISKAFWDYIIGGNSLYEYIVALAVIAGTIITLKIFNYLLLQRLKTLANRTRTDIDDIIIEVFENLRPPFYVFVAIYIGLLTLSLATWMNQAAFIVLLTVIVYQITVGIQVIIEHLVKRSVEDQLNKTTAEAASLLGKIAKFFLWFMAILFALSNFGINVTSLIAGVSIGGIAIAFAVQNILSDLFSSLAIYLDRPFEIGDFIVTDDQAGTIKKIGIKTTRLKALQGEEIVISNRQLTDKKIQNFKRMQERRISFSFGVFYDTPSDKLPLIPSIVEKVIKTVPDVRFNRAHLKEMHDLSLRFEVVYHVLSKDYNVYMDVNQQILLGIKQAIEAAGISFATPLRPLLSPAYSKKSSTRKK